MASRTSYHRVFTMADQKSFARASGDCNPLHLDPIAARRTQAGLPVVHGIHMVLWALEQVAGSGQALQEFSNLNIQFNRFLFVGQMVELRLRTADSQRLQMELLADNQPVTTILMTSAPKRPEFRLSLDPDATARGAELESPSLEEMFGQCDELQPLPEAAGEYSGAFPHLTRSLGAERVAGLGQLSRLVGMRCPGLHSIFSKVDIAWSEAPGRSLRYQVLEIDPRFRLVRMAVAGSGVHGMITAFARWPPIVGPTMTSIASRVAPDEFRGRTALIAGGSRGIGSVTARLLAAGGADVIITYHRGRVDAESVAAEIHAVRNTGACRVLALDARKPIAPQLAGMTADSLYWCVTPQIFRQKAAPFVPELFVEFLRAYVTSLQEAVQALPRLQGLFYPSSISIETMPSGMTEYIAAKLSGEELCRQIAAARPEIAVVAPRLPRILTDQTATIARAKNADSVEIMLPLIRQLLNTNNVEKPA